MPLPRAMARANRVGLNRVTRHLAPRVVHDPTRHFVPGPVRTILGRLEVADFLLVDLADPAAL